jgi:hypothetical protein
MKSRPCIALAFLATLLPAAPAAAQIPGLDRARDAVRGAVGLPSLSSFLEGDPPITTSLDDARTEIAFLDGYSPSTWRRMDGQPRTGGGAFRLRPGRYAFEAQSYCLKAGTHGPGGGDGYLYAPLVGPKATIVRNILRNSYAHPEIPQRDVQVLLWAIIARTKVSDMPRDMQVTAARLLTPREISDLNGGALGLVPEPVMREAMSSLPPLARQVFEAEARLRSMLTSGSASFAELERVAVLTGDAPPTEDSRPVPEQRWSYHPDGYFVRYDPSGYSHTRMEVVVPRPVTVERDGAGRIVSVVEGTGRRIEIEYDDATAQVGGDAGVRAYGVRTIRLVSADGTPTNAAQGGWTLVGVPRGGGSPSGSGRFADLAARYRAAEAWRAEWRALAGRGNAADPADALDIAQLHLALASSGGTAAPGGSADLSPAAERAVLQLAEAWQAALCGSLGCPSVSVSDVLILRSGEVRLGALLGCSSDTCWFDGSGVAHDAIAWIGLATSGAPPAARFPDVDEVHLDGGTVRTGDLASVSGGFVWMDTGYDRAQVEWIHLAGGDETPPSAGPAGGGGGGGGAPPQQGRDDQDGDDDDGGEEEGDEGDGGTIDFDPTSDVATPGNRSRQRLGQSGRSSDGGGGRGAGGGEDEEDPCEGERRNYDQAKALSDLFEEQYGERVPCPSDPRGPMTDPADCSTLTFDDEEQIEFERLQENVNDALRHLEECLAANRDADPAPY